jgi:hypothetical protein
VTHGAPVTITRTQSHTIPWKKEEEKHTRELGLVKTKQNKKGNTTYYESQTDKTQE